MYKFVPQKNLNGFGVSFCFWKTPTLVLSKQVYQALVATEPKIETTMFLIRYKYVFEGIILMPLFRCREILSMRMTFQLSRRKSTLIHTLQEHGNSYKPREFPRLQFSFRLVSDQTLINATDYNIYGTQAFFNERWRKYPSTYVRNLCLTGKAGKVELFARLRHTLSRTLPLLLRLQ